MKVLIVEDEKPAADKLIKYLGKYDQNIEILDVCGSVSQSVQWLRENQNLADLVFMDVQLEDGVSFDIFSEVEVVLPVIFITAYDEYAIDAFRVNGIDYLLKPVTFTDLSQAMKRLKKLKKNLGGKVIELEAVRDIGKKKYKDRFLVKKGNHIHSTRVENIAMFYAEGRTVFLVDKSEKKYIVDYKLEELEKLLDPAQFFRVNRSSIIQINAIKDVVVYSNSRLKVQVKVNVEKEIVVSREKVSNFKKWLD